MASINDDVTADGWRFEISERKNFMAPSTVQLDIRLMQRKEGGFNQKLGIHVNIIDAKNAVDLMPLATELRKVLRIIDDAIEQEENKGK